MRVKNRMLVLVLLIMICSVFGQIGCGEQGIEYVSWSPFGWAGLDCDNYIITRVYCTEGGTVIIFTEEAQVCHTPFPWAD